MKTKLVLTEEEIDQMAEDALNAACLDIQQALGVTDGGIASLFFSGDAVKREFIRYIHFELDMNAGEDE